MEIKLFNEAALAWVRSDIRISHATFCSPYNTCKDRTFKTCHAVATTQIFVINCKGGKSVKSCIGWIKYGSVLCGHLIRFPLLHCISMGGGGWSISLRGWLGKWVIVSLISRCGLESIRTCCKPSPLIEYTYYTSNTALKN